MPKMIIAALLSAFLLFSNSNKTQPATQVSPAVETNTVTVRFGGLMVFHKENNRPAYEVGILSPAVSKDHIFSLNWYGVDKHRSDLPTDTSWSLEVLNAPPTTVTPVAGGHDGKRRPDKQGGQFDFDWLIDLEGQDFHKKELTLKKNLLSPIIHLPSNALLSTEYKSMDLKRWQGSNSKTASYFGFVPETIDLSLELHPGEELVLKDDKSGAAILKLPFNPYQKAYVVYVNNVRESPTKASDFGLYYNLFTGIDAKDKFDFEANTDLPKYEPLNPYPEYDPHKPVHTKTCCMMLCTAILLGTRSDSLW